MFDFGLLVYFICLFVKILKELMFIIFFYIFGFLLRRIILFIGI